MLVFVEASWKMLIATLEKEKMKTWCWEFVELSGGQAACWVCVGKLDVLGYILS